MRSPPNDKTGEVKRFSYKRENSNSDGSYSWGPVQKDSTTQSLLGNSDMDVIWSVQKDHNSNSRNKLASMAPPHMKGFYSRYTSQDPRFSSQLGGSDKDSKGSGGYTLGQSKSKYAYSQDKRQMRLAESDPVPCDTQPSMRHSMQGSPRAPAQYKQAGKLDRSNPVSREGRHSSSS